MRISQQPLQSDFVTLCPAKTKTQEKFYKNHILAALYVSSLAPATNHNSSPWFHFPTPLHTLTRPRVPLLQRLRSHGWIFFIQTISSVSTSKFVMFVKYSLPLAETHSFTLKWHALKTAQKYTVSKKMTWCNAKLCFSIDDLGQYHDLIIRCPH
jgi:hypothetical protein